MSAAVRAAAVPAPMKKAYLRPLDLAHAAVDLSHGGGGRAMVQLISDIFGKAFDNEWLRRGDDGAVLPAPVAGERLVIATDAHVVSPLFFPGGDIGCLAVHGTINDVAMMGARPLYLAASFILEEGFPLADLDRIVASMAAAAKAAGVPVVYTGPVDRYFDYSLGELKWRTVDFREVRYDEGDHFGCPVMNFSDADVPYTRAIEFKNFNPERRASQNPDKTVVWEEYSRFAERGDEPYYPINTEADKALYARYEELAKAEPLTVFGGRLGTYKYYDMHNVIDTALTAYEEQVAPLLKK